MIRGASEEAISAGFQAVSMVEAANAHVEAIEDQNGWKLALLARLNICLNDVSYALTYGDAKTEDELLRLAATALGGIERLMQEARR